jgi:UDP-glucose 4-epimerase
MKNFDADVLVVGNEIKKPKKLPYWVSYMSSNSDEFTRVLGRTETLVYLANKSKPSHFEDGLIYELDTNVRSASEFLYKLSCSGFSGQLIFASSGGQIYGLGSRIPARESDPTCPVTPYGLGKKMCEEVFLYGARNLGLNVVIFRLSNPVGMKQIGTGHGLIGAVIRSIMDNIPLNIYGDGLNVRDYFHVDDLSCLIFNLHNKGWRGGGIFNIGSGKGYTEHQVLDIFSQLSCPQIEILIKEARVFDLPYGVIDPGKATKQIGWKVTKTLPEIIEEMLASRHCSVE